MTGSPIAPRLVKGGIVTMDPDTSVVKSVIALQYNADSLSRTLQIQAVAGGQDGVPVDTLRPRGPAVVLKSRLLLRGLRRVSDRPVRRTPNPKAREDCAFPTTSVVSGAMPLNLPWGTEFDTGTRAIGGGLKP
jgi:hypothetical protein